MIGFVYSDPNISEFTRSVLKYAYTYSVPVIGICLENLVAHFRGAPLTAVFWNGHDLETFETTLPEILDAEYNSFSKFGLEQYEPEFAIWLKEHTKILMQQASIPKKDLPNAMLFGGLLQYSIPGWEIFNYSELVQRLSMIPSAIIKPTCGRKGKGVCKLQKSSDGTVKLLNNDGVLPLTEELFLDYLRKNTESGFGSSALLQPCMDFSYDDSHALDFRLLRHRGRTGAWEEVGTYARVGGSAFVANVSQSGFVADPKSVLHQIAGEKADEVYAEIMEIGEKLPVIIQKFRGDSAYCLGIDVGVDRATLQPYVIEANTYPATKYFYRQLSEKRVLFYEYIMNKA